MEANRGPIQGKQIEYENRHSEQCKANKIQINNQNTDKHNINEKKKNSQTHTWNHLAKQHANKANSKQFPEELNLGNFMNPLLSLFS